MVPLGEFSATALRREVERRRGVVVHGREGDRGVGSQGVRRVDGVDVGDVGGHDGPRARHPRGEGTGGGDGDRGGRGAAPQDADRRGARTAGEREGTDVGDHRLAEGDGDGGRGADAGGRVSGGRRHDGRRLVGRGEADRCDLPTIVSGGSPPSTSETELPVTVSRQAADAGSAPVGLTVTVDVPLPLTENPTGDAAHIRSSAAAGTVTGSLKVSTRSAPTATSVARVRGRGRDQRGSGIRRERDDGAGRHDVRGVDGVDVTDGATGHGDAARRPLGKR